MTTRRRSRLSLLRHLRSIPSFLRDRSVPMHRKAILLGAILYVIVPTDAIPDVIPMLGWLDDVGALGLMIATVSGWLAERSAPAIE